MANTIAERVLIAERGVVQGATTPEVMRVVAARAGRRHPNLVDSDEVFIAFAYGQERAECCASTEYVDLGVDPKIGEPVDTPLVLRSHGVPIAVRIGDRIIFAASPARPGQPCLGRVMAHTGRAAVFVYAVLAEDDQASSVDRVAFAELCERYGIRETG